jgi:hypothetical protein
LPEAPPPARQVTRCRALPTEGATPMTSMSPCSAIPLPPNSSARSSLRSQPSTVPASGPFRPPPHPA